MLVPMQRSSEKKVDIECNVDSTELKASAKHCQEKLDKIQDQMKTNKGKEKYEVDPDNELEKRRQIQYELTCKFRHH